MKTKKLIIPILSLLLGIFIIPIILSCKKPSIDSTNPIPRSKWLVQTWKVEDYRINGNNRTYQTINYLETFLEQQLYSYSWDNLNGSGSWTLQNNDQEIVLNGSDGHSSRTLIIILLKEDSFWYYWMEGSNRHEFHMVPN